MQMRTRRKVNWIGHILCRNSTEQNKEGRIEVIGRKDISSYTQTLKRGYWKLKEEALDHTMWRTCFKRGYGPIVRRTTE